MEYGIARCFVWNGCLRGKINLISWVVISKIHERKRSKCPELHHTKLTDSHTFAWRYIPENGPPIWRHVVNKNTLETCKNPRPTSGRSEHPKSCTSTMNFDKVYPQNNAKLTLSHKLGESKFNPHCDIILTTSHGMNYVLNEHLDFSQHDPYATPSGMILWYRYSASFKNKTEPLSDLLHQWTHLTLSISLTIIKILANMTKMQYHAR